MACTGRNVIVALSLCCVVLGFLRPCSAQSRYSVQYRIEEEQSAYSFGNLWDDSGISADFPQSSYNYEQLSASSDLEINVNSASGELSTAGRIDRDAFCPKLTSCEHEFDFTVASGTGVFAIIKVAINIYW